MNQGRWLLFLYSLPAKPVGHRMKVWRKLSQIGAVSFRGAGYILPDNEEHYEYFQWLVSEVTDRGGEAAFIRVDRVELMAEKEVIALFHRAREKEYLPIAEQIEILERGLITFNQGGGIEEGRTITENLERLTKEFELVKRIDFFDSPQGISLERKIKKVREAAESLTFREQGRAEKPISPKDPADYHKKVWATRKRPYVDRMASAWLIRKFIDPEAVFKFISEGAIPKTDRKTVLFDIKNGAFTHQSDLCTFEVLIRSFGLNDKALSKMAEVVHQIDLRDKKRPVPEAAGLEALIRGIRKVNAEDREILEKGMALFEMLYASKIQ